MQTTTPNWSSWEISSPTRCVTEWRSSVKGCSSRSRRSQQTKAMFTMHPSQRRPRRRIPCRRLRMGRQVRLRARKRISPVARSGPSITPTKAPATRVPATKDRPRRVPKMTQTPAEPADGIAWPATTPAGRARAAALADSEPMPEPMEWVEYRSSGRLLIIGPADDAWPLAEVLSEHLACTMLATSPPSSPPESAPPARYLDGRPKDLTGHLGDFSLNVEVDRGRVLGAGAAFGIESGTFDLVLDLDGSGGLRMDEPPPGYFLATDPAGREKALEELPQMVGDFQKSRYFSYDPEICAHGASGMTGCSNCLLACATDAIVSIGDKIEVNPYLCQGCGSCATVCPSGAMQYQAPTVVDLIDSSRRMLNTFHDHAGDAPAPEMLLYSDESAQPELLAHAAALPEHVLPLAVEDVGSVGMDAALSLLAFGAARVFLLPGSSPAPSKVQASRF